MTASWVVIDTNIWIRQFLTPGGSADAAITKALERHTPVFARDTFEELRTRLGQPKLERYSAAEQRASFLERVLEISVFVELTHQAKRTRDPDDNKFLGLAMTIGARTLISGDEHLLEIKHYQGIQIWTPEDFLRIERERELLGGDKAAP
jgi:putative PIN family toxin of toxin-antitoxin system